MKNQERELLSVVFINKDDWKFCSFMFHFKAEKLDEAHYLLIDWLTLGHETKITKSFFEANFIVIEDSEFQEYEAYVNEGDTDKMPQYWDQICEKYSISVD